MNSMKIHHFTSLNSDTDMRSQSNEQCANCPKSYLGVNGRFCSERKQYVEYAVIPPCKTDKQ